MSWGKSRWIQKLHWYFTGHLSCLVASISAKRQVRCWQSSRKCVAAVDALTDGIEHVLYIKEGKPITCVPLFLFLSCLLWLLLSRVWSWQLWLAGCSVCDCSEIILCMVAMQPSVSSACPPAVNPSTWIHSFPLSTAGNFLFITPAVFFLAIIFSPTHPC